MTPFELVLGVHQQTDLGYRQFAQRTLLPDHHRFLPQILLLFVIGVTVPIRENSTLRNFQAKALLGVKVMITHEVSKCLKELD
jgi:hypothetical protein